MLLVCLLTISVVVGFASCEVRGSPCLQCRGTGKCSHCDGTGQDYDRDIIIIIIALRVKVPESVIDVKEPEYYNSKESLKSRFTISRLCESLSVNS